MAQDILYRLDIEGYPTPRPRLSKFGAYNPAAYTKYQKELITLLQQSGIPPSDYSYVEIKFYFPYADSEPQKKRVDNAPMRKKFDIDNLSKGIMDCLTKANIIIDDRLLSGLYAEKIYTTEKKGWIIIYLE
jgi:Holliday junction resolvase RusA-like endonuclease